MRTFILTLLFTLACAPLFAAPSDSTPAPKKKKQPTVITADKGSFFGESKNAELIGDVRVDDGEVVITCKRMLIISDTEPQKDTAAVTKTTEDSDDNMFGISRGSINRIECHDDVVIIRKFPDEKTGELKIGQRAKSEKAYYHVKTETIVLFGEPRPVVEDFEKGSISGDTLTVLRSTRDVTGTNIRIETTLESNGQKSPVKSERQKTGPGPRTTF